MLKQHRSSSLTRALPVLDFSRLIFSTSRAGTGRKGMTPSASPSSSWASSPRAAWHKVCPPCWPTSSPWDPTSRSVHICRSEQCHLWNAEHQLTTFFCLDWRRHMAEVLSRGSSQWNVHGVSVQCLRGFILPHGLWVSMTKTTPMEVREWNIKSCIWAASKSPTKKILHLSRSFRFMILRNRLWEADLAGYVSAYFSCKVAGWIFVKRLYHEIIVVFNVPLFLCRLCYVKLKLLLIAIEYKSDQRESRSVWASSKTFRVLKDAVNRQ